MKIVVARENDSKKLSTFVDESPWISSFDFKKERVFSFFEKYRLQSDDFITCMLVDPKDRLLATASILFRKAWIEGVPQIIGYASDLQVSLKRSVIMNWPKVFFPLLEEEKKKRNCKYVFSVLFRSQRQAYNALIRPKTPRRELPRYYLFRRFQIVTLHGLFPFSLPILKTVEIKRAGLEDKEALAQYILSKAPQIPFCFYGSKEDFYLSLEKWKNLKLKDFILVLNKNKIVGCAASWSNRNLNRIYVEREHPFGTTIRKGLNFLSFFGLAHSLYKKNSPEIRFRYLTHVYADNPDIFYTLLKVAYKDLDKREFLAYSHFEGDLLKRPPSQFIKGSIKCGLYCILGAKDPFPNFLRHQVLQEAPDFELPFI